METTPDPSGIGRDIYGLVSELYPICRSITGDGVRRTLEILSRIFPVEVREVPTGTEVLDWTVPKEWNIRDAWIKNARGERVVDFQKSNLHVVNYSVPVRAKLPLSELRARIHTLPDQPTRVPYRTSYYDENWGFCASHETVAGLADGDYEVCIDSTLEPGNLTYGEILLPGRTNEEILISAHVCHPSLCDDNLSGLAISVFLARALSERTNRRHSIRFVFAPGTIGTITWLARNRDAARRISGGLTVTCLGDGHPFTYKRTVGGEAAIDRVAEHVLRGTGLAHELIDFFPYGYDERQYNSPGFRVPVGSLMRGRHGQFPEYHTSGDDLSFVSAERMAESFAVLRTIVETFDDNATYRNLQPWGEPQLGRRGLYGAMGGTRIPDLQMAVLWVLNLSDGQNSLLDISVRANMEFSKIRKAAELLVEHDLLSEVFHRALSPE